MRRILFSGLTLVAVIAFLIVGAGAKNASSPAGTYKIEVDNAFGLVTGADFKVAGVKAGSITGVDLDQKTLHAVVTVSVTQKGFNDFRSDVFCQTRPQSLIGEYFIECDPGHSSHKLAPGSTIPVTRTMTTIAPDLLADIMRLPYRQRFSIILGEFGAAVAGRSGDLQAAIHRAVPALTETDNLLNLLANDSNVLQRLTVNSNTVITSLANNSANIKRFIDEAGSAAELSAQRNTSLKATFHKLPAFLEQLKPTLAELSSATDANTPVLQNLQASSGQLDRFLTDLVPFSRASKPAISSLGQASVTGRSAVIAAGPTVADLNRFAKPAPELARNLGIVLPALDNRSKAVEPDPRSPGGKGYTGLEALLQYVFNQALAINTFGPYGHMLAVDAFYDPLCSPYATPTSIASNLKSKGPSYRRCYSWLGPNQPGVNETDPSNPGGAVPDPGGSPPGQPGPATSAAKLSVARSVSPTTRSQLAQGAAGGSGSSTLASGDAGSSAAGAGQPASAASSSASGPSSSGTGTASAGGASAAPGGSSGGSSQSSAQSLLNYLLSP